MLSQKETTQKIIRHQISSGNQVGTTVRIPDSSGALTASISYLYFGGTRTVTGTFPTDKKFTGQRLDADGLYYYGARYYDAAIGRFISPDTTVQSPANPQTFNRYSYCLNNPLKFIDPNGHEVDVNGINVDNYYMYEDYILLGWALPQTVYTLIADPLFQAYNIERNTYSEAIQLELSSNVVNLYSGKIDNRLDSVIIKNGSTINVTINNNLLSADEFYLTGTIHASFGEIVPRYTDKELGLLFGIPQIIGGVFSLAGGICLLGAPFMGVPVLPWTLEAGVAAIYGGWAGISAGSNGVINYYVGQRPYQEPPINLPPFLQRIINALSIK